MTGRGAGAHLDGCPPSIPHILMPLIAKWHQAGPPPGWHGRPARGRAGGTPARIRHMGGTPMPPRIADIASCYTPRKPACRRWFDKVARPRITAPLQAGSCNSAKTRGFHSRWVRYRACSGLVGVAASVSEWRFVGSPLLPATVGRTPTRSKTTSCSGDVYAQKSRLPAKEPAVRNPGKENDRSDVTAALPDDAPQDQRTEERRIGGGFGDGAV